MAKHCTICNQDYADELATCPHCAAAKKTQLASRQEDRTTKLADVNPAELAGEPPPSDSAIDLEHAHPAGTSEGEAVSAEPASGTSAIAWSSLVEGPSGEDVKIDSPSDADILRHQVEKGSAAASPGGQVAPADSAVDLGGAPVELVEDGSKDESGVYVAELASDADKVELASDAEAAPPHPEPVEEVSEVTAEAVEADEDALDAVVVEDDESSAVNLGAPRSKQEIELPPVEVEEAVETPESGGINLEGLHVPRPSHPEIAAASDSSVDLGSHAEITPPASAEEHEVAGEAPSEPPVLGFPGQAHDQVPEPAVSEEAAVSEEEVNALLEDLERPASEPPGLTREEAAEIAEGEQAIAAAEAEEAAETAASEEAAHEEEAAAETPEEEEKPARPSRQRSRIPALAGGTLLGILLGAGGLIGARVGGFDVPAMIGVAEKPKQEVKQQAQAAQAIPFAKRASHVRNGDWEEAAKAGINEIAENNADELAARGSYRLGVYLTKVGAKIKTDDPALQTAVQDLQKAAEQNNADAQYDLGLINELAGKLPEARKEYAKGLQAHQNDAVQKQRFQSAVDRVESKAAAVAAGTATSLLLPENVEDRAVVLALLLIGLQPPPQPEGQQSQTQPEPPEAGEKFWNAVKLARQGKYGEAQNTLKQARDRHDARRFTRLRKAQNPLSDPAEDIFLRCCDELMVYWRLEDRLRAERYLTDKNTPTDALNSLVQQATASESKVKELTEKFIQEKVISKGEDLSKGVDRLVTAKNDAEAKVADLTTKLKKATDENTDLAGKLKTTTETLKDRESKLKTETEAAKRLRGENADLNASLKKIIDELVAAKLFDPKGKEKVDDAVKKAVDVAKIKDPQGMIRQQRSEIEHLTASLKERWQPEEMLPLWLLLLDQNRNRVELTNQASMDVERVKSDPKATPTRKGEAEVVLGLALRNAEKFQDAKNVLEKARRAVDKGDWLTSAESAYKDVSDPAAYYSRRAQALYEQGRMEPALELLNRAMKFVPASEQGKLFARRSLIELDAARAKAKGALGATDPFLVAARRDAEAAVKAGSAEGHFAAGRIAEELGQWDTATKSYRKAMAAHPALDADGSRYRMALARVLLQPRDLPQGPPQPATPPAKEKVGWRDPAPYPGLHRDVMKQFVAMLILGFQPPFLPGEDPGLEEAEKLADEVLKAPANTIPFPQRAQALAVKGRWTAALQTYTDGVRPMLPREYADGLIYFVLNHPRLKRPDSLRVPNPLEAERHFAAGLNFYFDREYNNAEREFLLTIENDGGDARYFYFLGLSRMALNRRRDAYDDFDQGATLERLNRPAPAAVSESLERIQGPTRQLLNDFRKRQ